MFSVRFQLILILRDQYTSPKIIKLMELETEMKEIQDKTKLTAKMKKRLSEIEDEMKPLKQFLEDARFHRAQIKKEIGMFTSSDNCSFLCTNPIVTN